MRSMLNGNQIVSVASGAFSTLHSVTSLCGCRAPRARCVLLRRRGAGRGAMAGCAVSRIQFVTLPAAAHGGAVT